MSAPVMADVTVGGQIGASYISASKGYLMPTSPLADKDTGEVNGTDAYRTMMDNGLSKVEFSGTDGDAYFKFALDTRTWMNGANAAAVGRDFYLGYKFGASSIQAGRMPAALAGLEGDKYNATFLELRRTAAVSTTDAYSTDTYFNSPILQFATKAGGASIKIQYDAQDKSDFSNDEGYYAVAVKGAAGAFGYFAGVNNGSGTDTAGNKEQNIKAGASMKMGAVKATLMVMNSDKNSVKASSTAIMADMGLGNGLSLGVAYGMQNSGAANKDTFMRLAATKSLSKMTSLFWLCCKA
jgi:hypothetical protein